MSLPSSTTTPCVSVGLPVYNGGQHLAGVLDDLLQDEYRSLEILISDNASTDGTGAICREYAARDARIRYSRNPENIGGIRNFVSVCRKASGKYFMWASHHDRRDRRFIARCVERMEADPALALCYAKALWWGPKPEDAGEVPDAFDTVGMSDPWGRFFKTLWTVGYCYPIYGVIRRSMLEQCLLPMPGLGPDHVWLQELSLQGTFQCLDERLMFVWRDDDARSIHRCFARAGRTLTPRSALAASREMIAAHLRIIDPSLRGDSRRAHLRRKVLWSVLFRYRRLFSGVFFTSLVSTTSAGAKAGS